MSETGVAQNKRKLPTSTAFVSTRRARQRRKETCIHLEVSKVFPSATSCVPRGGDEYFQNKCTSAHLSLCTDTLTPLGGDRAPPTGTSAVSQKYETQNQTYPDTSRNYVRERQCTLYRNVTHCAAVGNQKSYVKISTFSTTNKCILQNANQSDFLAVLAETKCEQQCKYVLSFAERL